MDLTCLPPEVIDIIYRALVQMSVKSARSRNEILHQWHILKCKRMKKRKLTVVVFLVVFFLCNPLLDYSRILCLSVYFNYIQHFPKSPKNNNI